MHLVPLLCRTHSSSINLRLNCGSFIYKINQYDLHESSDDAHVKIFNDIRYILPSSSKERTSCQAKVDTM